MIDKVKIIVAILSVVLAVVVYYQFSDLMQLGRVGIVIAGVAVAVGLMMTTEMGHSTWSFIKGANIERQKVIWPTRPEAVQVTMFVIVLVIIIGLVMWVFDALSFYMIYDVFLRVRGT